MDIASSKMHGQLPPGATYVSKFISGAEQAKFVALLDAAVWSGELKRRVQHFGYRYDYKARAVASDAYLGPLPGWLEPMGKRLVVLTFSPIKSLPMNIFRDRGSVPTSIVSHVSMIS